GKKRRHNVGDVGKRNTHVARRRTWAESPDMKWLVTGGSDKNGPGLFRISADGATVQRITARPIAATVFTGYLIWVKPHERNPGKMTCTTASGLLPAGIAVYVQQGPNGVGLEMRYPVGLEGVTSQRETRQSNSLLPAWEIGCSLKIKHVGVHGVDTGLSNT